MLFRKSVDRDQLALDVLLEDLASEVVRYHYSRSPTPSEDEWMGTPWMFLLVKTLLSQKGLKAQPAIIAILVERADAAGRDTVQRQLRLVSPMSLGEVVGEIVLIDHLGSTLSSIAPNPYVLKERAELLKLGAELMARNGALLGAAVRHGREIAEAALLSAEAQAVNDPPSAEVIEDFKNRLLESAAERPSRLRLVVDSSKLG